jgi:aminomethyltransferase
VATAHAAVDSDIFIDIRNTLVKAKVVKFPFK